MIANPTSPPIRILTVDDHPMLREGIAAVVADQSDMQIVGEASNGAEAIERFTELLPDVTLMDLQMPDVDGIDALKTIRARHPDARVVVLTTYAGDAQALRAMQYGAVGYLLKSALRRELVDTIRLVHTGKRYITVEVATDIALHSSQGVLSEREVSVLAVVAAGKSNKEIALALAVSEATVKAHLKTIFSKLGVADRTEAVTLAARRGIITL
ncbi:MAG TPA: response regulator transcription factor [Gammaproteobacteria bacterium]|nr:response regulator transcription factor [Gammaproteobacteria bacterium]